jgi:hypothetical protein
MTQRTARARPSRVGDIVFMGFLCMLRVSRAHYGIYPIISIDKFFEPDLRISIYFVLSTSRPKA